jgi:hypothetical protein
MNHTLARRGMGGAGIGLLVILIALGIILYLFFGNGGSGKSYTQTVVGARNQAREIKQEINTHELTQFIEACALSPGGKLPTTPEETGQPGAFRDPWGGPITFTYKKEGEKTTVVYHSNGPDGQPNTSDDVTRSEQLQM